MVWDSFLKAVPNHTLLKIYGLIILCLLSLHYAFQKEPVFKNGEDTLYCSSSSGCPHIPSLRKVQYIELYVFSKSTKSKRSINKTNFPGFVVHTVEIFRKCKYLLLSANGIAALGRITWPLSGDAWEYHPFPLYRK